MSTEALALIGRDTTRAQETYDVHAGRLSHRDVADSVHTLTYEHEPVRDLRDDLEAIDADTVYAVPMTAAHTFETLDDLPAALSHVPGTVRYCEPPGRSPATTEALTARAADHVSPAEDATLVVVALGSSSKPYHRQTAEYHAARLREGSAYGEVVPCYLLQNPAVECVRYNVSNDRAVAVPLFLTPGEATAERIPRKLDVGRGGIEYADPVGDHHAMTDAIHAVVAKQRALTGASDDRPHASFETDLVRTSRRVATDGEGRRR